MVSARSLEKTSFEDRKSKGLDFLSCFLRDLRVDQGLSENGAEMNTDLIWNATIFDWIIQFKDIDHIKHIERTVACFNELNECFLLIGIGVGAC